MDLSEFSALDDIRKLDYVIDSLKEARSIFAFIYYGEGLNIDDVILLELDDIGDALFEYGELAEGGHSDEIFIDLNTTICRLRELSLRIRGFN